jgi:hypothetical protein
MAAKRISLHGLLERSHTLNVTARTETTTPAGATNGAETDLRLRRNTGRAAQVLVYAISRTIALIVRAEMNVLNSARPRVIAAVTRIAGTGVRKRGCVVAKMAGS